MFDALTYQEMLKEIKENSEKYGTTYDMAVILITRPDLATGKDILNSLEYYHFRTSHFINFYLPVSIGVRPQCYTAQCQSDGER